MNFSIIFLLCQILVISSLPSKSFVPFRSRDTYTGFIPVNTGVKSGEMFYWFFPSQVDPTAPVLLWLQGGPGGSGLEGNLLEFGPYFLLDDFSFKENEYSWTIPYSVIFIDNPLGTGFSVAHNDEGYVTNQDEMAENLYDALVGFFKVFPDYSSNDFYITGESYAGKYIPSIAHFILQKQLIGENLINLKGIAIGDGFTDPVTQVMTHAETNYLFGLFDEIEKEEAEIYQLLARKAALEERWLDALQHRKDLIEFTENVTGGINLYDMRTYTPYNFSLVHAWANQSSVRKLLQVGDVYFQNGSLSYNALMEDIMKSVKVLVPPLIENYKVLLYQGQFDIRDGVAQSNAWIKTMDWTGIENFLKSPKKVWKVDSEVAGYVKQYSNLTQTIVLGAGHLAPMNQPRNTLEMMTNFIENKPWN